MSTKGDVQVRIGGDLSGQVVIGNHNIQIGNVNGGIVNLVTPTDQPEYSRRSAPVNLRPRSVQSFFDREEEIVVLRSAVNGSVPISVYGEEGIGKSTFVSRFVNLHDAGILPDGIVYMDVLDRGLDDLLQSLFEIFYASKSDFKPREATLRLGLSEIKALIVLDHLHLPQDKIKPLLNYIPRCAVILSSAERNLWGNDGKAIPLQGLPLKDALSLFEHELDRPVKEEEKTAVEKIIELLHGHPLHIAQAVSLIREKSRLISDVLLQLQNLNPEQTLLELSLGELTESQKRDMVILAASGGAIVPLEHLVSLSQDQNTRKSLRELMGLRLVQAHSPRYSLTGNLVAALASQWDLSTWEDALIDYFTDWLEKNPAQTLVEESAEVLIHFIKKAGEKKRWQNVIRMGRKLESGLALWKRWQAWADILELILKAAKAMGDKKVEAWVLHQLGSRAMCLDFVDQARELLNQAMNMRQAIGDQAGLELTQHNLNVLGKPLIPSSTQKQTGCRRCCVFSGIGVGTAILLGAAILIFVAAKTLDFFSPENKTIHNTDIPQMTSIPSMPTSTPKPAEGLLSPATETYTDTPSTTPTATETLTYTPTATQTFTPTATKTLTYTPTATQTFTPTVTKTLTYTLTVTRTYTPTPSYTPIFTRTKTPSPTSTNASPPAPKIKKPLNNTSVDCTGTVSLEWIEPKDSSGIAGYDLELELYNTNKKQWDRILTKEKYIPTKLDITSFMPFTCGSKYQWRVQAVDKEGAIGPWTTWSVFYPIQKID